MTTAFVLSGGASHGAVQVGMLMALAEKRIYPDLVVGTSVGALNGAWVAGRPELDGLEELAAVWAELKRGNVFPLSPPTALAGVAGLTDHLVPSGGLERIIEKNVRFDRVEDAPVPFAVVATDVLSGQETILRSGDTEALLLATAAIPGVFAPVEVDGRPLMDGGVTNNTPLSAAVELGADCIYVLPAGYACALPAAPKSALAMALHAFTLSISQRLLTDVERYEGAVDLHVLPPLCPLSVSPADFSHGAELITRAHADAVRWLERPPHAGQARLLAQHRHRQGVAPAGRARPAKGVRQGARGR